MLAAADVGCTFQLDAAQTHCRAGIGVAERLEQVERLDVFNAQKLRITDQQIRLDLRYGGGSVIAVIARERGAEIIQLVAADVQPRGERVAAEADEVFRAGGERVEKVEAAVAAARALSHLAAETDHDRGQRILLGKP